VTRIGQWSGWTLVALVIVTFVVRSPVEFLVTGLTDDLRLKLLLTRIVWLVSIVVALGMIYLWLRGRSTQRLP
jgi:hypothetical protein